jgi:uncharacterized protein
MVDTIEKLLILQDRDRKIHRLETELAHIGPEREALRGRYERAKAQLEQTKANLKQLESNRKDLELEVEAKKDLITRYANQQFQTRKNDEYRALAHEIDQCKAAIFKIEDQEIALMEQGEAGQKEIARGTEALSKIKADGDEQKAKLDAREQNLKDELAKLQANREELAAAVDARVRGRYERLMRSKGENVVVGVQHGVCGGCHMRLPPQVLVMCQAKKELVTCGNCGRILYYTRDMDLAVAE